MFAEPVNAVTFLHGGNNHWRTGTIFAEISFNFQQWAFPEAKCVFSVVQVIQLFHLWFTLLITMEEVEELNTESCFTLCSCVQKWGIKGEDYTSEYLENIVNKAILFSSST